MARRAQIRVYLAADGWRWRQVSANGKIVADSGQPYQYRNQARRAARAAATGPLVLLVDGDPEVLR